MCSVTDQLIAFLDDCSLTRQWFEDDKIKVQVRKNWLCVNGENKPTLCLSFGRIKNYTGYVEFVKKAHELNPSEITYVTDVNFGTLVHWFESEPGWARGPVRCNSYYCLKKRSDKNAVYAAMYGAHEKPSAIDQLTAFLESDQSGAWLEDDKIRAHVNLGQHVLDKDKTETTLDVEVTGVHCPGKHVKTQFIEKAHELNPYEVTYVKNMFNLDSVDYLKEHGWKRASESRNYFLRKNQKPSLRDQLLAFLESNQSGAWLEDDNIKARVDLGQHVLDKDKTETTLDIGAVGTFNPRGNVRIQFIKMVHKLNPYSATYIKHANQRLISWLIHQSWIPAFKSGCFFLRKYKLCDGQFRLRVQQKIIEETAIINKLAAFLDGDRNAEWLNGDGIGVYATKTQHVIDGELTDTLDLGNIAIYRENRGLWIEFIEKAHELNPVKVTCIKSVSDPELISWLKHHGWKHITFGSGCFFLRKNKLPDVQKISIISQLHTFLDDGNRTAQWISGDGITIRVVKTQHVIDKKLTDTLDLGTITVDHEKRDVWIKFIEKIHEFNPVEATCIEKVSDPELLSWLEYHSWKRICPGAGYFFLKK